MPALSLKNIAGMLGNTWRVTMRLPPDDPRRPPCTDRRMNVKETPPVLRNGTAWSNSDDRPRAGEPVSDRPVRFFDKWWPMVMAIGMVFSFVFGVIFKGGTYYQQILDDHEKTVELVSWKEKQETFNNATTVAIARLQEITRKLNQ